MPVTGLLVFIYSVYAEYVLGSGSIFWGKASKLQLLWNLHFVKCLLTVFGEQKFSMAPDNSVASGISHNPLQKFKCEEYLAILL